MTNIIGKVSSGYDRNRLNRAVQRATVANRTPIGEAEEIGRASCRERV
jgi:hypothetical protein